MGGTILKIVAGGILQAVPSGLHNTDVMEIAQVHVWLLFAGWVANRSLH